MPLDGIALRCSVNEIKEYLLSSVQKIYQPEKDEIVIILRTKDGNKKLLISSSPESPRLQITNSEFKNPESAPMFCMLLRKHFSSGKLIAVNQAGLDRTVDLVFECHSEMGDKTEKHIIVEIMGRSSNIIVTDSDYKIFDCMRKNDLSSQSARVIIPKFKYEFLVQSEKCDITKESKEAIKKRADMILDKDIVKNFVGFSPLCAREAEKSGNIEEYIISLKRKIENNEFQPSVLSEDGKVRDFWCFSPLQYGEKLETETYLKMSEAMDKYYEDKDLAEHMKAKTGSLTNLLTNLIARGERKIKLQMKELSEAEKMEEYKAMGDLITANIYKIKKGDKIAEVSDWSEGEEKIVRLLIDENLSPSENAQRYYKKYAKAKNAKIMITEQIKVASEEIIYLESVLHSLENAKSMQDISEIKYELSEGGYIQKGNRGKEKGKNSGPLKEEYEGFSIYIGKNNIQNEFLTLKFARKEDIWLHVKNSAGSHVLIESNGRNVPDSVIERGAYLAALNSKAKGAPKTEVDYTKVKFVKKIPGSKPGMVIYTDYKTCII